MARILIVGCGCRGRELADALARRGHAVRGTTRDPDRLGAIESVGVEAALADPDRLSTLAPHLEGVSVLCWLMGTATGPPDTVAAVHGPRLESLLETIVDTPVRGAVYEAAGTVDQRSLEEGAAILRRMADTYLMPVQLITHDPADHPAWLEEATTAVDKVLAA